MKRLITAALVSVGLTAVTSLVGANEDTIAEEVSPQQMQTWFDQGVRAFQKEKFSQAVSSLSRFQLSQSESPANEEWALFFLALSYEQAGLTHAAVETFRSLLTIAANPQTVNAAVAALERISRTHPFDRNTLVNRTLIPLDVEFLTDDLQNFRLFYQGQYNWSTGFIDWGNDVFANIDESSEYFARYLILDAQRLVFMGNIDTALEQLTRVLKRDNLDEAIQAQAASFIARLNYEQKRFVVAADQYDDVLAINSTSSALLERAWSLYMAGHAEQAYGLLHAFSAPSYRFAFTPEFFILKTHIQKDHCHYDAVGTTQEHFFERYESAVQGIYDRKNYGDTSFSEIHRVLLQNPRIKATWEFLLLLENEIEQISVLWPKATKTHLRELYLLKIEQTQWELGQLLETNYEATANALLVYSEEMNLIGYEMGVERFQSSPGAEQISGQRTQIDKQDLAGKVRYPVDGEYWNDELKDYIATLSDECLTTETWSANQ
jgi:tetratricopeptide (TPR) repeat protein